MAVRLNDQTIGEMELRIANGATPEDLGFTDRAELYEAVHPLIRAVNPDVRGFAMDILYSVDKERAYPALCGMLQDEDDAIRLGAVEFLAGYSSRAVMLLRPLLHSDPCPDVWVAIAAVMGDFGTLEVEPDLLAALNDDEYDAQQHKVSDAAADSLRLLRERKS